MLQVAGHGSQGFGAGSAFPIAAPQFLGSSLEEAGNEYGSGHGVTSWGTMSAVLLVLRC